MEITKKTYVGCYGIVYNDQNEVLLIKKAGGAYKGKLDLPGGGIEYGESVEETLKREFVEEVGLKVKNHKLKTIITNYVVWTFDENYTEDLQHIAIIYDVELEKSSFNKIKTTEDGRDSLGANWYKKDELTLEELSPLAKIIKERE